MGIDACPPCSGVDSKTFSPDVNIDITQTVKQLIPLKLSALAYFERNN